MLHRTLLFFYLGDQRSRNRIAGRAYRAAFAPSYLPSDFTLRPCESAAYVGTVYILPRFAAVNRASPLAATRRPLPVVRAC